MLIGAGTTAVSHAELILLRLQLGTFGCRQHELFEVNSFGTMIDLDLKAVVLGIVRFGPIAPIFELLESNRHGHGRPFQAPSP